MSRKVPAPPCAENTHPLGKQRRVDLSLVTLKPKCPGASLMHTSSPALTYSSALGVQWDNVPGDSVIDLRLRC